MVMHVGHPRHVITSVRILSRSNLDLLLLSSLAPKLVTCTPWSTVYKARTGSELPLRPVKHAHTGLQLDYKSSSDLKYSPTSDWWKTTMALGSAFLHSLVALAVTPNPRGTSVMEYITTPVYAGVPSVILPSPDLSTWFPYKNCISAVGFTQTCKRHSQHEDPATIMSQCCGSFHASVLQIDSHFHCH